MRPACALAVSFALVACGGDSSQPMTYVVVRNHTDSPVDGRVTIVEPQGSGSTSGPTPACDVGAFGHGMVEGQEWSATVGGVLVVDSGRPLPDVQPGEVLEIVIDVFPNEESVIGDVSVRDLADSVGGEPAGHSERPGWSERLWELAEGLRCTGPVSDG